MGGGSFSSDKWSDYSKSVKGSDASKIYTSHKAKAEFVPEAIKVREAFDNEEHPLSTPIILAPDVTGSMGGVLEALAKRIGNLMLQLLDSKTVTDPQIASMAIGDILAYDKYPLQFTQFESDNRCVEQLTSLYFERGGGGNDNESYSLAWFAAANMTDCDAFKKRGKKGFLFTFGDEYPTDKIPLDKIRKFFPDENVAPCPQNGLDSKTALEMAEEKWHCFHIIIAEGSFASRHLDEATKRWTDLMGQRAIVVRDIKDVAEVVTSIIEVTNGVSVDDVVKAWNGSTAVSVKDAVSNLVPVAGSDDDGLVSL